MGNCCARWHAVCIVIAITCLSSVSLGQQVVHPKIRESGEQLLQGRFDDFIPPIAQGEYLNFESAPVKSLAYEPLGRKLLVANTPNSTLDVFDASGPALELQRSLVVGMDPVSVAVQPQSAGQYAWTVNKISDTVTQVDLHSGVIKAIVEVADAPVNILFNDSGTYAYVISQGATTESLTVLETSSARIVGKTSLPCDVPMAAIYDAGSETVYAASQLSGNNTTTIGGEVSLRVDDGVKEDTMLTSTLLIAAQFSLTRDIFERSELAPLRPDNAVGIPSPITSRIVQDAGLASAWQDIVDVLVDDHGQPRPEVVMQFEQEFEAETGLTVLNASDVLARMADEHIDTTDNDLCVVDVSVPHAPNVIEMTEEVGTILTGMVRHPVDDVLWVANLQSLNHIAHEPMLNGHFVDHRISQIDITNPIKPAVVDIRDLHGGLEAIGDAKTRQAVARAISLANPTDILFDTTGSRAYVASLGTGRVGVLDGETAALLAVVDVGRGTRSLAMDQQGQVLYALNRTDHTISVLDVSDVLPRVRGTVTLSNPEPAEVKQGRDFLYSTRYSNDFSSSCALCHVDGHIDRLAWDLGDPTSDQTQPAPYFPRRDHQVDPCLEDMMSPIENHPVKGPMTTQSLRGLANHEPLHWRGDKPRFEDFNGAFENLMGGKKLTDQQMLAFRRFAMSIVYPPNNTHLSRDFRPKDERVIEGLGLYENLCISCHQVVHDGAKATACFEAGDLGDFDSSPGKQNQFLVVQLRGLTEKGEGTQSGFSLAHDGIVTASPGSGSAIESFINQAFLITGTDAENLAAFLRAFPSNVMPVVGWQYFMNENADQVAPPEVMTMIDQHEMVISRCDVVVAQYFGERQDMYYYIGNDTFEKNDGTHISTEALFQLPITPATPMMVMSVPPGSGQRMLLLATGQS